jgi:integrase
MGKTILISELVEQAYDALRKFGFAKKTMQMYRYYGFTLIRKYYREQGKTTYSKAVTQDFIHRLREQYENGSINITKFQCVRRSATILDEYYQTGKVQWKPIAPWRTKLLNEPFCSYIKMYEAEKLSLGRSVTTMRGCKPVIKHFLLYIESLGYKDMLYINREDISSYIPVLSQSYLRVGDCLCILRTFGRFMLEHGLITIDMPAILKLKVPFRKKYAFGFTHEETDRLFSAVNRDTAIGKRDYAILMLAQHTGMRAIDVLNLKFNNMDWQKREIKLVQHKTGASLVLPVDLPVCNAIADYILNARPVSELRFIFLRSRSPHTEMKSWSGYSIVKRNAAKAGIFWAKEDRKGFHSFRRSLGSWMLEAEVPLDTIREVLGHRSRNSAKPYISTQTSNLYICSMGLGGITTVREELQ